jgi:hypothetical protein
LLKLAAFLFFFYLLDFGSESAMIQHTLTSVK